MHNFCNFQNIKGEVCAELHFPNTVRRGVFLDPRSLVFESSFWCALCVSSEQLQAITLPLPAFAEELRMAHHALSFQPLTTRPARMRSPVSPWTLDHKGRSGVSSSLPPVQAISLVEKPLLCLPGSCPCPDSLLSLTLTLKLRLLCFFLTQPPWAHKHSSAEPFGHRVHGPGPLA